MDLLNRERVVRDKLRGVARWCADVVGAGIPLVVAGVVAGCADADSDGFGSSSEADSADRTSAPSDSPPEGRLFPEVFSVLDATAHDDAWFVLDGRATQVHRIGKQGGPVLSFGREGSGPGEFRGPGAIVAHGDSIVVVADGILHLFSPLGEHIADRRFQLGPSFDCLTPMTRTRDAVSLRGGVLLMLHCTGTNLSPTIHAAIETADGFVRSLARLEGEPGVVDLASAFAVISRHPRGFLFGSASRQCLDLFSPSGEKLEEVCHEWLERPDMPPESADQLEDVTARARRAGVRFRVPETMPPFISVSVTAGGRLIYMGPAPGEAPDERMALITLGEAGQAVTLPSPAPPFMFQDGLEVLAVWEEMEGTRIALLTLDDPDAN